MEMHVLLIQFCPNSACLHLVDIVSICSEVHSQPQSNGLRNTNLYSCNLFPLLYGAFIYIYCRKIVLLICCGSNTTKMSIEIAMKQSKPIEILKKYPQYSEQYVDKSVESKYNWINQISLSFWISHFLHVQFFLCL